MRAVLERDFLFEAARPRAVMARTLVAALVATTVCHELTIVPATKAAATAPAAAKANLCRRMAFWSR